MEPIWWIARVLCYPLRPLFRVRGVGWEHIGRRGPVLLACNHVSFLDPLALLWLGERRRRKARFLAKAELWNVRGLRFFLGAKLLTHFTNLLYRAGIHDEATCYKVFRRSLISEIDLHCQRFEFCPEVTAKLCRMGEKIAEVPISYHPRSAVEGKKIRYSDGWLAIWTLLRYRFGPRRLWLKRGAAPQAPFAVCFSRIPTE